MAVTFELRTIYECCGLDISHQRAEFYPREANRPFTNKNPDSTVKKHKLSCHSHSGPVVGLMDDCPQINLPMRSLNNTTSYAGTYIHI